MENKFISIRKNMFYFRRKLRLLPMQRIIKTQEYKGIKLNKLSVLDVFAGDGNMTTLDIANVVEDIDLWEINQQFEATLRSKMPHAKITICNSYEEINKTKKI